MAHGHLYSCGLGNSKLRNKLGGRVDGVEGWMLGGSGSAWRKATKYSALGHATKSLLGPHSESTFRRLDGPILHANFPPLLEPDGA